MVRLWKEMRAPIELGDYALTGFDSNWIQFKNRRLNYHSDAHKVHISVAHDAETIHKAQALIIPILLRHQIGFFKTVNPDNDLAGHRNLDGKEICIYMQIFDKNSQESNPVFWIDLLNEIEAVLAENGVARHPQGALGDLLFPGSKGYVFYRNPQNIGDNYVSASLLMESGFTRKEACEISKSDFFHGHALAGNPHFASPQNTKPLTLSLPDRELDFQLKQTILDSFYTQLTNNHKLLALFIGTEGGDYCRKGSLCNNLFGTKLNINKRGAAFAAAQAGELDLVKPFRQYLDRAAEKMAKVATILIMNGLHFDATRLGSILPALYFNYYVPLYLSDPKGNATELNDVEAEKLINEIIRCGLRDPSKTAIDYESPQYIQGMTESNVVMLLSHVDTKQETANADLEAANRLYREFYTQSINQIAATSFEVKYFGGVSVKMRNGQKILEKTVPEGVAEILNALTETKKHIDAIESPKAKNEAWKEQTQHLIEIVDMIINKDTCYNFCFFIINKRASSTQQYYKNLYTSLITLEASREQIDRNLSIGV
ncbi:hypothetical protein [Legionella micdadei]|uniref:Uncharacterized protein n=2 Tax=Legionella micdadei TaxID=451 RepID=A0A098GFP7_LEGMI|nr:hypothetical protein [Legionella micdadei]CEG61304.1 protein of unknown function [Legionella micdadei]